MDYQSFKIFDKEAEKVVEGLRIADCMHLQDFDCDNSEETTIPYNLKELAVSDVLTCSYCNVSFSDASNQRSHYKLDWHRYNLKRALSGNKSVPEEVFSALAGCCILDYILFLYIKKKKQFAWEWGNIFSYRREYRPLKDDVSSISGSDSEGSDDSDTETSEPIKRVNLEYLKGRHKTVRHAKAFFENTDNKILSVYKCLLHSKKESPVKEELVKRVYNLLKQPKKWMVLLLGGGHFASAIFCEGEILNHKTFHCYTVRAKQGGSQSSRDSKGGSHPKSAGASLRRYNEQALVQHVQEIIASWSEPIKQCSLILYRATGPYNRGVLFGGKNPPLSKTDVRLRNIPFPTRRATLKEVKRVYEMLSSIEIYGVADNFKDKFPANPDKRTWSPKSKRDSSNNSEQDKKDEENEEKNETPRKIQEKHRNPPQKFLPEKNIQSDSSESEEEDENDLELISSDITVSFQNLQEYEDTVPQFIKDLKNSKQKQKKKKKKLTSKQKAKLERKKWMDEFERIQGNLVKSCENADKELLMENLNIYAELPEREPSDCSDVKQPSSVFTKEDFIDCLNAPINDEDKNTLLHLAAIKGLSEFITSLMTSGADPTIKNKNKLTPYVMADKETRNSFRLFAYKFPDKFDLKKANIPEPLNEEQAKELEERKKEKKKLKRIKEKIKKQVDKEKRNEEEEKKKFLSLSDREKCALAAERRLIASSTSNLKSAKPPVLSRCFQCGIDITGIVAFEYGSNRFCTIPCLKAHRLKTSSYGKEI